jgi:N-acetylmuramoyl-L-alanine amidase
MANGAQQHPSPDSPLAERVRPSPNHGERVDGQRPVALVVHYTGMPDAHGALNWLVNPVSQVSCHYFVFEDGRIWQLVPEARRAWHAGRGAWRGITDMNSASIGIEIVNPGHEHGYGAFPAEQITAVTALCADIVGRHAIAPGFVIAHSDMAPDRKQDPGELFPWQVLHTAGVGHWVPPAPIAGGRFLSPGDSGQPVAALQSMLALYGYTIEPNGQYDEWTRLTVAAFQRHHRPALVDGIADGSTITTLRDLIRAEPRPAPLVA